MRNFFKQFFSWQAFIPEMKSMSRAEYQSVFCEAYPKIFTSWRAWAAFSPCGFGSVLGDHLIGGDFGRFVGGVLGGVLACLLIQPMIRVQVQQVLAERRTLDVPISRF